MAIAARTTNGSGSGSVTGTSIVVTKPSGVADGDLLIVGMYNDDCTISSVPSGWALVEEVENAMPTTDFWMRVYWKRASSEGASWTWTASTSGWHGWVVQAYTGGLASGDPLDGTATEYTHADYARNIVLLPSITTTIDGSMLVAVCGNYDGRAWVSGTAPVTNERVDANGVSLYDGNLATAGASGIISVSIASAEANQIAGIMLALKPAAAGGVTGQGRLSLGSAALTRGVKATPGKGISATGALAKSSARKEASGRGKLSLATKALGIGTAFSGVMGGAVLSLVAKLRTRSIAVTGNLQLSIERDKDAGGYVEIARLASGASAYVDDGPFSEGSTYSWRVRWMDSEGNSGYSNIQTISYTTGVVGGFVLTLAPLGKDSGAKGALGLTVSTVATRSVASGPKGALGKAVSSLSAKSIALGSQIATVYGRAVLSLSSLAKEVGAHGAKGSALESASASPRTLAARVALGKAILKAVPTIFGWGTGVSRVIAVGDGYSDVTPRAIVRTSDGRVWIASWDFHTYPMGNSPSGLGQTLLMYKADQLSAVPASFTVTGSGPSDVNAWAMAVDHADTIHVAYTVRTGWSSGVGTDTSLVYRTYNTATGTWSSPTTVDSATVAEIGQGDELLALALDANGVPHVVYLKGADAANRRIYYRNRIGGSWSSATQLDSGHSYSSDHKAWHPGIAFDMNGRIIVTWADGAFNGETDGVIICRVYSGSWSSEYTIATSAFTGIDQGTPIYVDASNRYHFTYLSGASKYVRYSYSDNLGATWTANNPSNQIGDDPAIAPSPTAGKVRIYAHGTDATPNIVYWDGDGGSGSWGSSVNYFPDSAISFDCSVGVRWSRYFHNWSFCHDVIYWAASYPCVLYFGTDLGVSRAVGQALLTLTSSSGRVPALVGQAILSVAAIAKSIAPKGGIGKAISSASSTQKTMGPKSGTGAVRESAGTTMRETAAHSGIGRAILTVASKSVAFGSQIVTIYGYAKLTLASVSREAAKKGATGGAVNPSSASGAAASIRAALGKAKSVGAVVGVAFGSQVATVYGNARLTLSSSLVGKAVKGALSGSDLTLSDKGISRGAHAGTGAASESRAAIQKESASHAGIGVARDASAPTPRSVAVRGALGIGKLVDALIGRVGYFIGQLPSISADVSGSEAIVTVVTGSEEIVTVVAGTVSVLDVDVTGEVTDGEVL